MDSYASHAYIRKKRIVFLVALLCTICFIVAFRFFILQAGSGSDLKNAAAAQQSHSVLLYRSRGNIVDRNGIPFTNRTQKKLAVFEPLKLFENNELLDYARHILGFDKEIVRNESGYGKAPLIFPVTDKNIDDLIASGYLDEDNPGVSIVEIPERYSNDNLACHIIGYLREFDGTGAAGLEAHYENELKGGDVYISIARDALNVPIAGTGMKLEERRGTRKSYDVKLTLDYDIQKIVEEEMDETIQKGGIVVIDIKTGDILAMVSRPDFHRDNIVELINTPGDTSLFNRAVAGYSPGSVFKIVGASIALEEGVYLDYECEGDIEFSGLTFECYGGYPHGNVNLESAFTMSCNTYFINFAVKTGADKILEMAEKLGFGKETGIYKQGVLETNGTLPVTNWYNYSYGEAGNMAIGQGDIIVSPVQIASMTAAIANKGVKTAVNIVDSILDREGKIHKKIRTEGQERVMPVHVARMLGELMKKVTSPWGTGSRANIDDIGGAAGKTGSAEAFNSKGEKTVHAWFTGYFPYNDPKYAITVFVEDGGMGGDVSAPVFASIARRIITEVDRGY